ncbi:MAG: TolC family protein [Gammaproteobacteria bacterium]
MHLYRILVMVIWILVSLSMASCQSFTSKPLSLNATEHQLTSRTLTDRKLAYCATHFFHYSENTWPPKKWGLADLTVVALYYHPDLSVARSSLKVSEASIVTAGMIPNPSVSLSAQYQEKFLEGFSHWTYQAGFGIPIETAGKRSDRIKQATYLSQAARLNVATTVWQVRSNVRKAFLNYYAATQSLKLLQKQQELQTKLVNLYHNQLKVGEVSKPDVTLAEISLNQTTLALEDIKKQKAEAFAQLANALGVTVPALDGIKFNFADFEHSLRHIPSFISLQKQALHYRSDILALLSEYEASQAALQLQIAKQYPDITLGPGYQWMQGSNVYMLMGPSFMLPIFNQNQGPIAEAKAKREEAAAKVIALQSNIIGQLTQNYKSYHASLNKLDVANQLFKHQFRSFQSAKRAYHIGEVGKLEFQTAAFEYAKAGQAQFDTLIQTQQTLGMLEDSIKCPLTGKALLE